MAAKIAKILAAFVDKKKVGKKLGMLVLSIAFGLIFLLMLSTQKRFYSSSKRFILTLK